MSKELPLPLLLKEPFGHNNGTGVKFKYHGKQKEMISYDLFSELFLGFSCHPPAIPKIYNCLKYSREYTCFLQTTWFERRSFDLEILLKKFQISFEVFYYTDEKTKLSTEKRYQEQKESFKKNNIDTLLHEYLENAKRFNY